MLSCLSCVRSVFYVLGGWLQLWNKIPYSFICPAKDCTINTVDVTVHLSPVLIIYGFVFQNYFKNDRPAEYAHY